MDQLYHKTNALLQTLHQNFVHLEAAPDETTANQMSQYINQEIIKISANCERLDMCVMKEPPARKRAAKYKVDQLKYDLQHNKYVKKSKKLIKKSALYKLEHTVNERLKRTRDREDLLNRRYTANDSAVSLDMQDSSLLHNDRLNSANRNMDEIIDHGQYILGDLRSQHSSLKDVKRKMLEVGNTLGMSNTVLRLIERRTTQDWFVLFAGMIITTLIMYCAYRLIKG